VAVTAVTPEPYDMADPLQRAQPHRHAVVRRHVSQF